MVNMDVTHPDIEDFIDVKNDLTKVTSANISVNITDDFMKAVLADTDFNLYFKVKSTGEEINKIVRAKDLFRKLATNNFHMAEPGILYDERIHSWHLMSEDDTFEFAGVNPCVSGDTLILTDKGHIRIDSLVGQEVSVWNGFEYSNTTPKVTGYNQKMKLIRLSDGSELNTTHYHEFILKGNKRIEAKDLKVGDKLAKWNLPIIDGTETIEEKTAYTQGFFMGDGGLEVKRGRLSIKLYGEKRDLIDKLQYNRSLYCESFDGEFLTLEDNKEKFNKEFVPSISYTIGSRLHWLAGYLDSDGTLQSADGAFSISSVDKFTLEKVKYMLSTLGCHSSISVMREAGERMMPKNDGSGESKLYSCQTSYRLLISSYNVKGLIDLGLKTHRLPLIANPNRDASRFIEVVSIKEAPVADTVYCFNEPKNHSGIFNGIMTAQCAEETLPAFGSCNLSSINLSEFVKNPFTENAWFDFEGFSNIVREGVVYLNAALDENMELHPLQEQRDVSRDLRQIGCGIMGLADMFIKMGISYGSKESIQVIHEIGSTMVNNALQQSALLAKEQGPFPLYNEDAVLRSPYLLANATEETLEMIKEYGLRNSQLLTIAPTGSISTLIGCSNGVEPIFQISYTRKSESLHNIDTYYKVFTPIAKEYMEKHEIVEESDLPDFFVTTANLNYKNRIDVQAAWQQYIDASISSTVNVPNEFTVEEIEELYIYAWTKGLKGTTIYRDGCARHGILITDKPKESSLDKIDRLQDEIRILALGQLEENPDECPMCSSPLVHSGGCSECMNCGYSPCSI